MLNTVNPSFLLAGLVILALTSIYLLYLHLTKSHDINGLTGTVKALINQNRKRDEVVNFLLVKMEEQANMAAQADCVEHPGIETECEKHQLQQDTKTTEGEDLEKCESEIELDVNDMDDMDSMDDYKRNVDNVDKWHTSMYDDYGNDLLDEVIRLTELHLTEDGGNDDNNDNDTPDAKEEKQHHQGEEEQQGEDQEEQQGEEDEEEQQGEDKDMVVDDNKKKQYKIHVTKNKQRLSGLTVNQLRKAASERNIVLHGTNKAKIINDLYAAL